MITDIKLIEPNYEGIAKVLAEFEKLYKVCDNRELLDKSLETFLMPRTLITSKENAKNYARFKNI